MEGPKAEGLRPVSYDADLDPGDSPAENRGRTHEIAEALARIHARDRQHRRPAGHQLLGGRESAAPLGEVERLGHDRDLSPRDRVDLRGDRRGVAAWHDHATGTRGVETLPASLDPA